MGHGKGRGGSESGVIEGGQATAPFNVRMLDQMSQSWMDALSKREIANVRQYFQASDNPEFEKMQSALDKAPSINQAIDAYIPVNKDTIGFVRNLAQSGGSLTVSGVQEMHLWKSTALESSSATNRIIHVTLAPGVRIGGVTSLGGKDLRAPKLYTSNLNYRVKSVQKDGNTTIYNVMATAGN